MKKIIQNILEILFTNIPFSRKTEEAKYKIEKALEKQYVISSTNNGTMDSLQNIVNLSSDIYKAGILAGYTKEEIDLLKDSKNIKNKKELQKLFKKYKTYTLVESAVTSYIIFNIINFICYMSVLTFIISCSYCLVGIGLNFLLKKRKIKFIEENRMFDSKLDQSGKDYLQAIYDKYTKKQINSIFLSLAFIAYLIFMNIIGLLMSAYTIFDVLQQISYSSFIIITFVFLVLKNSKIHNFTARFFVTEKEMRFNKQVKSIIIFCTLYWIAVTIILFFLRSAVSFLFEIFLVIFILYTILLLIYNLSIRKQYVFKNITINSKRIVSVSLITILLLGYQFMSMDLWLTQPYINTVSAIQREADTIQYNNDNGVYTITTNKEQFNILQLTDIHLGGSVFSLTKDLKALKAIEKLIIETKPDLVVVTGDLVFPMGVMSFSLNNRAPVMQFASFMRNIGIPWVFTYGNHDTEMMSVISDEQFDELMKTLSYRNSKNLLYPYIQPDIYGRNNQMIEIRHTDGRLMQSLFLLDSNDYIEGGKLNEYDYIHDDQVEWYRKQVTELSNKEGYTISSMLFFHMPLQEYKEAYDLYEKGNSEVIYNYGEIGETMIDKICCSKYPSKLFDTALQLGSTKVMFCGHDHYNNLSLKYKGIQLTYGYSIDYLVMPGIESDTKQRGGTLITITKNGGFQIEPYRLIDLK